MVGNASEEAIINDPDHPSQGDPVRVIALLFLVIWISIALFLSTLGLTLLLSLTVAFVPVALVFLIIRQIRTLRHDKRQAQKSQVSRGTVK